MKGQMKEKMYHFRGVPMIRYPCGCCDGTGWNGDFCKPCNGRGYYEEEEVMGLREKFEKEFDVSDGEIETRDFGYAYCTTDLASVIDNLLAAVCEEIDYVIMMNNSIDKALREMGKRFIILGLTGSGSLGPDRCEDYEVVRAKTAIKDVLRREATP